MREPSTDFWSGRPTVVTGGAGFLGSAVVDQLESLGAEVRIVRSNEFDLRDRMQAVAALEGTEVVVHLAANAGGIGKNRRYPAALAHDNMLMAANVFEGARTAGANKLVCAGTVCSYPSHSPIPFSEDHIWSGYPEETNAPYGIAKRMLFVLSDAYRRQYGFDSCVPVIANLYGPGDNYDLEDSHVIPAMIRKFAEAQSQGEKQVVLWGSGDPTREFLYVHDAGRALLLAAEHLHTSLPVNVGSGVEVKIRDLAATIRRLVGYEGEIVWDDSRPDGQAKRSLDVRRARELIGFEAKVGLEEGLALTIAAFRETAPQAEWLSVQ